MPPPPHAAAAGLTGHTHGRYMVQLANGTRIAVAASNLRPQVISEGTLVMIYGVISKATLNGVIGKCGAFNYEKRRYIVQVEGAGDLSLKDTCVYQLMT